MTTISDNEWTAKYRPIKNPVDPDASCDGDMFETYGEDLAYVLNVAKLNPLHVWTYQDDDNGIPCIVSGYHLVNRIGYFITELPCEENDDIYVDIGFESSNEDGDS
jgi:hypothetical protein